MQINFIPKTSNHTELNLPNSTEQSNDGSFSSVLNAQNSETTLESIFKEASDTYQVPLSLLKAVGKQESNFNPKATSRCGAQGIMQLMPATAAGLGVTDAYDPKQNIMGGAKYLSELLSKYDGNTTLALAAYNAGSNNVAKYGGVPPFKETQDYVVKVTSYMENGVTLPDQTVSVASANIDDELPTDEAESSFTLTASRETPDASDALDELFSYNDYLKFIDIFLNNFLDTTANLAASEQDKKDDSNDSYTAYQNMQSRAAMENLFSRSEEI